MQILREKINFLENMSRVCKANLKTNLILLENIQMDKIKVYQKIHQLPDFTRNLIDVSSRGRGVPAHFVLLNRYIDVSIFVSICIHLYPFLYQYVSICIHFVSICIYLYALCINMYPFVCIMYPYVSICIHFVSFCIHFVSIFEDMRTLKSIHQYLGQGHAFFKWIHQK